MGFLMPKPPRPQAPPQVAPAPAPAPAAKAAGPDASVFKTARERADEAAKRQNRDKLRIPLNTFAGASSGLQI